METQKEGGYSKIIAGPDGSKTVWILMGIGLLVYIILFFGSGNSSFFGLLGMVIGGLAISKIIAYIFSLISKEKSEKRKKITWAIVFLITPVITFSVMAFRKSPDIKIETLSGLEVTHQGNPTEKSISQYKSLKVSDGTTTFSFEVPEKWLTETRHSGEKQPTTTEMREFLADNCDRNIYECNSEEVWSMLNKLSSEEVKKHYFRTDLPYPSASVSAGDHITYSDMYGLQIDFNIKKNVDYYTYSNVIKKNKGENDTWSIEKVGGLDADVITFAMDKDEKGKEISTKMGSGGKKYYIRINNGRDMFVIYKEAKRDDQFEADFRNIIQTFKFENESAQSSANVSESELLALTEPLLEKYNFLDGVISLSIPEFEDIYQKSLSNVAYLRQLQSITYRKDIADVLSRVLDESKKISKVIIEIKNEQDRVKQGMVKLNMAKKTFNSAPIELDFKNFIKNETLSVDAWIQVFDPKNPDNLGSVMRERDIKTKELIDALIFHIKNTQ